MKILFDHHSPFLLAHGGFQTQIERTFSALRAGGTDVDWLRWWETAAPPNIIHYFGPAPGWYLDFCEGKEIKTVVSVLLSGLGSRREWQHRIQAAAIRILKSAVPRMATRLDWGAYTKAKRYLCVTAYEAKLLHEVFGADKAKISVVPNAVEECFTPSESAKKEDWYVTTVTITPRKRVHELVRAAGRARVKLRILGRPYSLSDPYYRDFLSLVEANRPYVEYGGEVTNRPQLADNYRRARGFVLVSSSESQSLSALEAAACGCPLILTDLPWARATFGDQASYIGQELSVDALASLLKTFCASSPCIDIPTWPAIARQISSIYHCLD